MTAKIFVWTVYYIDVVMYKPLFCKPVCNEHRTVYSMTCKSLLVVSEILQKNIVIFSLKDAKMLTNTNS